MQRFERELCLAHIEPPPTPRTKDQCQHLGTDPYMKITQKINNKVLM